MLSLEYHPLEFVIANLMGKLLGVDPINSTRRDPRFCVALDLDVGWAAKKNIIRPNCGVEVFIVYECYPMPNIYIYIYLHILFWA